MIAAVVLSLPSPSPGKGSIGPRLTSALRESAPDELHLVWVSFADKGPQRLEKMPLQSTLVTAQSLRRRANVLPAGSLLDDTDLPVEESYVAGVSATGAAVQNRSKWLNAVSVRATVSQIDAMAALPFVREVELVGRYRGSRPLPPSPDDAGAAPLAKTSDRHSLDYGPSINQVSLINVPALHDSGNSAQGVIVGVFDDGFRMPNHEAFASMKILATYDFVDHKVSVVPDSTWLGDHGVNTLSTIGGYKPGELIGPAFGASFILARTENTLSETPLEEDNWVRAIEWADSLGVQVTSTSLGYLDYDAGYTSWTWENMDGRTTAISRAAAMAVRKGILVVNSAGNEGYNTTHNTLTAPADADSVVAAGAVDLSGRRASFSSVGPSAASPPRIKPDLMAPGVSMVVASAYDPAGFASGAQGTSFACPLVAGVAALLVKAHPSTPPMQIVAAMKATASQASRPDNLMGWGVVNAPAAHRVLAGIDTIPSPTPESYVLQQNYPNPFNPGTRIAYSLPARSTVTLTVFDVVGREVRTLASGEAAAGTYTVQWDGRDNRGVPVATGVYVCRLTAVGANGVQSTLSSKMLLLR